jgi:hypothetical protein
MVTEIPEIEVVNASTGMEDGGMSPSFPGEESESSDDGPEAPF